MNFKNNLCKLMKDKKINTRQLSIQTNIPYMTIRNWINLNHIPTIDKALIIANFFNITLDELVKE